MSETFLSRAHDLLQFAVVVFAVGFMTATLIDYRERGWPKSKRAWAYPLIFTCYGVLLLIAAVFLIALARRG